MVHVSHPGAGRAGVAVRVLVVWRGERVPAACWRPVVWLAQLHDDGFHLGACATDLRGLHQPRTTRRNGRAVVPDATQGARSRAGQRNGPWHSLAFVAACGAADDDDFIPDRRGDVEGGSAFGDGEF